MSDKSYLNIQNSNSSDRIVGQSNEMIRKTFYSNLEIDDIKLFRAIISKINYRDSLFDEFYILNYDELDMIGMTKNTNRRFIKVINSLKKLSSTFVNIIDKDGIPTEVGLIKNKFKYPKKTKQILVEIDEDLMPYLLELKGEYTKYQLSNIGSIKSVQQLKLYELLRSWADKGKYRTTLENLRDYLEIKEGTYKVYGNFKQKILGKALDIINKETDISVELEELKLKSFKVDTLIFHIELRKQEKVKFDITEFIDKVFIDKSGVKYLVKSYIKDSERIGYFNLELLSLDTYKLTKLAESLPKEELYQIIQGRIDILESLKKANKNKKKINDLARKHTVSSSQKSKTQKSRLSGMTQQERINNFKSK